MQKFTHRELEILKGKVTISPTVNQAMELAKNLSEEAKNPVSIAEHFLEYVCGLGMTVDDGEILFADDVTRQVFVQYLALGLVASGIDLELEEMTAQ